MPTVGQIVSSLGKQHHTKPVTKSDKAMSKLHKAHRKAVDKMPNGPKKKALSDKYNVSHAVEHIAAASSKAKEKVAKKLMKMGIKVAKKS